ncbi:uncharacterized protein LOC117188637 [Drosophila miranda]|uniref:uncharacterized protein LOC117188637 n=1 Tax=Drosophila miranda TaxID=7229 RepID=UPI00143F6B07|nr:uncharacterized protein LOC117188637 [Drosophila miranda]
MHAVGTQTIECLCGYISDNSGSTTKNKPIPNYYVASLPCGCPLNDASNATQPIGTQDAKVQRQPIPKKLLERSCNCTSTSSIDGPCPKKHTMQIADQNSQSKLYTDAQSLATKDSTESGLSSYEDMAGRYQENKRTPDTSQYNVPIAKDSSPQGSIYSGATQKDTKRPNDSSTQTYIAIPNDSFTQTETITPREKQTPKDVVVKTKKQDTPPKSSEKRFWKRPQIVVRSSNEFLPPQNQAKQEDKDYTGTDRYHKETQYKDSFTIPEQDYNDQTAKPKGKSHKNTQYEDSNKSEGSLNGEICATCALVSLNQSKDKMIEMEMEGQRAPTAALNQRENFKTSSASRLSMNESSQTLGQHSLQSRGSTLCQFCQDKDLPVLDHLISEVIDLIGCRPHCRIVMTVLLRADNFYHVNIRELGTGRVLGCLLANDAAIEEAISLGLFDQILTFVVTDVRSTIKPKDGPHSS